MCDKDSNDVKLVPLVTPDFGCMLPGKNTTMAAQPFCNPPDLLSVLHRTIVLVACCQCSVGRDKPMGLAWFYVDYGFGQSRTALLPLVKRRPQIEKLTN